MSQAEPYPTTHTHPLSTIFVTVLAVLASIAALGSLLLIAWREILTLPLGGFPPVRFLQGLLQDWFPHALGDSLPGLVTTVWIGLSILVLAAIGSAIAEHLQDVAFARGRARAQASTTE